jgi:hypothetical protein
MVTASHCQAVWLLQSTNTNLSRAGLGQTQLPPPESVQDREGAHKERNGHCTAVSTVAAITTGSGALPIGRSLYGWLFIRATNMEACVIVLLMSSWARKVNREVKELTQGRTATEQQHFHIAG